MHANPRGEEAKHEMEMKPAHFSEENLPIHRRKERMEGARRRGKGREGEGGITQGRVPATDRPRRDRVNYERFKPRFVGWFAVRSFLVFISVS